MGGVCPCGAGAEKLVKDGGMPPKQPAAAKPKVDEKTPLLSKEMNGANVPPPSESKPLPQQATMPATSAPPAASAMPADVPAAAPAAAAGGEEQGESLMAAIEAGKVDIGSCVEVYSNSYGAWCPGVIYLLDAGTLMVAYQVPGEPADANISTKSVPPESSELRLPTETGCWLTASVEVYSHSNKAWCLGKVTENVGGVLSVVFFYPNEPPDAVPVMKQLALGDKDLRLRGIADAFGIQMPGSGGVGHDTLQAGSQVEVYSNSLGVWCPGWVDNMREENGQVIAVINFHYPDMDRNIDEPAQKELPLYHQDLRVPGYEGAGFIPDAGPPVEEKDLTIGGQIEVFSASRQVWIVSTVKEIVDGQVTVTLRYPDMPPDSDLYEKVLPIGNPDMRLPRDAQ